MPLIALHIHLPLAISPHFMDTWKSWKIKTSFSDSFFNRNPLEKTQTLFITWITAFLTSFNDLLWLKYSNFNSNFYNWTMLTRYQVTNFKTLRSSQESCHPLVRWRGQNSRITEEKQFFIEKSQHDSGVWIEMPPESITSTCISTASHMPLLFRPSKYFSSVFFDIESREFSKFSFNKWRSQNSITFFFLTAKTFKSIKVTSVYSNTTWI